MCNGVLFTVDKLYYVFVMSDASRHSTLRNARGLRFKVLMMMMMIFWVVTLYRVISKYQHFGKRVPILWAKDVPLKHWYIPMSFTQHHKPKADDKQPET